MQHFRQNKLYGDVATLTMAALTDKYWISKLKLLTKRIIKESSWLQKMSH